MSLLDEAPEESRTPEAGGIVGMLKRYAEDPNPDKVPYSPSLKEFTDWLSAFMGNAMSPLDRAVKEVRVKDMGIMTYAAVDKDGIPVAFYGDDCRAAMLKYKESNR